MEVLSQQLRTAADDVAVLGNIAADFAALSAAGLLSAQGAITALRACTDRYAALAAGKIAHRSRPELGNNGMAQALGHVSPEAMIQSIAKLTRHEGRTRSDRGTPRPHRVPHRGTVPLRHRCNSGAADTTCYSTTTTGTSTETAPTTT